MDKVLGEYYTAIVWTIWLVWVPMVVKGEFGFIPSLCSAIVAAGIGFVLTNTTATKSSKTKLWTLVGSVVVIIGFMAVVTKPEATATSSEQSEQAE